MTRKAESASSPGVCRAGRSAYRAMPIDGVRGGQAGLTLLELLVTIAVLAIVLSIGVPAMTSFFDSKRLIGAAEQVYSHLQQARLESIARSAPIYAKFSANGGASWVYGISHRDGCDLTQVAPTGTDACVIVVDDGDGGVDPGDGSVDTDDLVLMRFDETGHDRVTMATAAFASGDDQIRFDPVRGTATAGEVHLLSGDGRQLQVRVGPLGQTRICTPDGSVPEYRDC